MPDKIELDKPAPNKSTQLPADWPQLTQSLWRKGRQPFSEILRDNLAQWFFDPLSLGFIVLILINIYLCISQPFAKVDPASLPATHTWTWWATQEYLNDMPPPPVVLLGSSLFMHPIARQDADFLNKDFDYVRHHYSLYLSKQLQNRFHLKREPMCFNFSLPGDLVSDQYMVARSLFTGNHKPRYIILGTSLRDFIDNAVKCPGTTPPFRYLQRFTDISDISNIAYPQFWQKFDYYFGQLFYPWAKRLDLQALSSESAKTLLAPLIAKFSSPSLLNDLDYRRHAPASLHSEVEEGMDIIQPHIAPSYDANYADYIRRYGTNNGDQYLRMFNIQRQFFLKLLTLCKHENIKLIIVNMPLTPENKDLMPPESYQRYMNVLKTESNNYNFPLLDLNKCPQFIHSDFYDTAHMNSAGGKKLLDLLANSKKISL